MKKSCENVSCINSESFWKLESRSCLRTETGSLSLKVEAFLFTAYSGLTSGTVPCFFTDLYIAKGVPLPFLELSASSVFGANGEINDAAGG